MKLKNINLNLKTLLSVAVLVVLIFSVGCSLWPFGKEDSAAKAQKLKSESDTIFNTVQTNSNKFDGFLKTLDKTIYSGKDLQGFTNTLSTLSTQITQDETNINELKNKLSSLSALDKENKYSDFIKTKTAAAEELSKAITKSKNIVTVLNPKMATISKLFGKVDELKKTQSDYVVAMLTLSKREQLAALSRKLIASTTTSSSTSTSDAATSTDSTTSSGSTDSTTSTDTSTSTDTTNTTDTTESSGSTSTSTADLEPWVYQISKSEWPSSFSKDFAEKTTEELNALYTDFYILNKELKFKNTKLLADNIVQIKADNADLAASIDALITNLRELTRYSKDKENDESKLKYYQSTHNSYLSTLSNRPAGVSPDSVAAQGMRYGHELSHDKVVALQGKIKALNNKIKNSNALNAGTLQSDYKESKWRFLGSLNSLYKINISISTGLTDEVKKWKDETIAKYVYQRLEHLAEAKHNNYKANKLYVRAMEKVASK